MYINNKTMFSLLSATTKPIELIEFAKKNNLPAIGICDIDSTQGFYSFSKLANNKGVKAILAVDTFVMYKNNVEDVLLICKNMNSLYEINKALSQDEYTDYEQFKDTIVVFKNANITAIKDKDYIGVTRNFLAVNEVEIKSNMLQIDSTFFAKKNDFEFFEIVSSIKNNMTIRKVHVRDKISNYLKKYDDDMWYYDDLYKNYLRLVTCLDTIEFETGFKLPKFNLGLEISNEQYLYKLVSLGLKRRLNDNITKEYQERLDFEFKVIKELNFIDYFLIVWDIIKYCKQSNIYVGPGRGSAAGSLLAYCLGITSIDPVANGLLFERFLNPMRKTMPDIDLDFEDTKREQIVDYIIEKYGNDYVCKIGTLSTFQAKSSFREVAKAIDLNKSTIDSISKQIDSKMSFKQNILKNKKLAREFSTNGQLQYILDYIYKIEDLPKNKSIHAAGVIISDKEIYNYTSLEEHVSSVDSKTLEEIGLVKFDILAISNLRHLSEIEAKINSKYHKQVSFNTLDLEDKTVYHSISDGNTNFVFQLESTGMIAMLKKFRPVCFDDLAAILALYRPGPMQFIDEYIDRKNGKKAVEYIHNDLKEVLASTYGIIVYQEQIMEIVRIFAGYDLGQADIFRRAISKKDKEVLSQELNNFVKKSMQSGYSKEVAIEVGKRIEAFANYGFNKSHAYSYAKISYALMYYKVNYPDVYFSYYLNLLKSTADMAKFEQEVKYFDLALKTPSVTNICLDATTIDGRLQLGLNNIKGIDNSFRQSLYTFINNGNINLNDIIDKCIIPSKLGKQEVENLVCSGLFTSFEYNERSLVEYILSKDEFQDMDALLFFEASAKIEVIENYNLLQLEAMERNSLNLNIRYNSYDTYFDKLLTVYPQIKRLSEVDTQQVHNNFDILVEVIKIKEIRTKTDKLMAFIDCKVEGLEGSITVFPNTYEVYYDQLVDLTGYALVNVTVINNGFSLQKIKKI